jgi:Putative rhamnosyl transferase
VGIPGSVPKLLIATRFGVGVTDRPWLEHRLDLISSITAPSVANQSNPELTWAILVDDNLPSDLRAGLETAIEPLDDAHLVRAGDYPYSTRGFQSLARDLGTVGAEDRMLTARLDDDDAWNRRTVERVYRAAAEWIDSESSSPGVGLTFDRVVEWVMYDMLNVHQLLKGRISITKAVTREVVEPFASMSVFVLSPLRLEVSARSVGHQLMHDWLLEQGFDVRILEPGEPGSLYCRHKQANTSPSKGHADPVELELGIDDLSETFGIDAGRTSAYLAEADAVPYLLELRPNHRRRERAAINKEIKGELEESPPAEKASLLRARQRLLFAEEARVSSSKVAAFPELLRLRGDKPVRSHDEAIGEVRGILAERARASAELEGLLSEAEMGLLEEREKVDRLEQRVRRMKRRLREHETAEKGDDSDA